MTGYFGRTLLLVLVSLLTCSINGGASRAKQQPIGTVLCSDGLASCPVHSSTCCLGKSNQYYCCPLPNAVCCADGLHCCPQCFSCNVKGNSCLRPAADAAAVRIFSLVSHLDKRIQTPPPTPPAAAAVAAAAKQREIEEHKAAAYAAAVARKKAAEESEGFVSGVLSAVKLTLFSNADDSKTKNPIKATPSLSGPGSKQQLNSMGARPNLNIPQPPLKALNPQTSVRSSVSGISKSSRVFVQAASNNRPQAGKQAPKVSPHAPPTSQKPQSTKPDIKQSGGGVKKPATSPQKEEPKVEQPSSGFFSSVFSAVTDFYSGGKKGDAAAADKNIAGQKQQSKQQTQPKQPQQLQQKQQQQQQLKPQQQQKPVQQQSTQQQRSIQQQQVRQKPVMISKQQQQQPQQPRQPQQHATSQKFQARTVVTPVVKLQAKQATPLAAQKVSAAQAGIKQQGQGFRQNPPIQQHAGKQTIGISQKSAAAAMATQDRKAKAWEAKQTRKL